MRFVPFSKVSAVLVAAALVSAPMAEAGIPGADGLEKAKEAVTELVEDGVVEEMGVGERRVHHDASTKSRKPRMSTTGVRQTWTECVGMDVDETIDMIKTARPDLKRIMKVKEGAMVTMDMRMDRVRVYYNTENKVTRAPRVG